MSANEIPPIPWGDTRRFIVDPPEILVLYLKALTTGALEIVQEEESRGRVAQTIASATLAGAITLSSIGSPSVAKASVPEAASVFVVGDSIADGLRSPGNLVSLLEAKNVSVTGYVSQVSKRVITQACEVNPIGEACQSNVDGLRVLEQNAAAVDAADKIIVVLNANGDTNTVREQTIRLGEQAQIISSADGDPAEIVLVGMFGNNKNVDAINRNKEIEAAAAQLRAEEIKVTVLPLYDFVEQNLRPIGAISQASPADVHPTRAGYQILASHIAEQIGASVESAVPPLVTPSAPSVVPQNTYIDLVFKKEAGISASPIIVEETKPAAQFIDLRFKQEEIYPSIPITATTGTQVGEVTTRPFIDISYQHTNKASTANTGAFTPAISEIPKVAEQSGVQAIIDQTTLEDSPPITLPDVAGQETTNDEWPVNTSGTNGAELLLPVVSEKGVGVSGDYNEQRSYGRHSGIDLTGLNPAGESGVLSGVSGKIISIDRIDDSEAGVNIVIGFQLSGGNTYPDEDRIVFIQHRELTELDPSLTVGQLVSADTIVGMIGDGRTSGSSDGPHDHLQLYTTNPLEDERGFTIRATEGYTIDPMLLGFRQDDGTSMMIIDGEMQPAPESEQVPAVIPAASEEVNQEPVSFIDIVFTEPADPLEPAIIEELPETNGSQDIPTDNSVLDYENVDPDEVTQIIVNTTEEVLVPADDSNEDSSSTIPETTSTTDQPTDANSEPTPETENAEPPITDVPEQDEAPVSSETETGTTVTPEGLRGDTIPEQIVNYYADYGFTIDAAYGIAANVQAEAQFDSTRTENRWQGKCATPPERLDPGTRDEPGPTRGYGFGIYQWTFDGFQNGLQSYADSVGKPWYDLKTQMDYSLIVWAENYPNLIEILQTTTDPAEAAAAVVSIFERPWPWDPDQGGNEYEQQKEMTRRGAMALELKTTIESGNAVSIDIACD